MKAITVTIEIEYNNEYAIVVYKNINVFKAISNLNKDFKGCSIYTIKTEY